MGGRQSCRREIAYTPLVSQKAFHDCGARFKGFSGPIGSGKSQALCQEAIKLSYLNPGRLGLLGAPTYPMLRDATQATLFEVLDRSEVPYDHNKAENMLVMRDTRSRILFRPVDDFERLRGTNLAWFGLDELTYVPEEAWLRLEGRLRDPRAQRLCGFAVWTPKGYDWVYRKFLADPVEGYACVIAKPSENRFLLDKIPDFYKRLEQSYDANFYRQEVLGEYLTLNGARVYSSFDRNEHVRDMDIDMFAPLLWTLDFSVDPMSSLIVQIVRGTVRILGEIVLRHASTQEACEAFHNRFPRYTGELVVYGDASGSHQQTSGTTDYKIVMDFLRDNYSGRLSYRVPRANPPVRDRVALVNGMLRSAYGEVRILVSPACKELIKDFEQVSFKPDSNEIDKERDRRRTHLSDALGYLLWQEFKPEQRIGEQSRRLL